MTKTEEWRELSNPSDFAVVKKQVALLEADDVIILLSIHLSIPSPDRPSI